MTSSFKVKIDPNKHRELIELAEEPNFANLIDSGVALLFKALKLRSENYKIAAIPMSGDFMDDLRKMIIFDL